MAVAKVKHIDIFFCKEDKDMLLSLMQRLGIIQITRLKDIDYSARESAGFSLSETLNQVQNALEYLSGLEQQKGFLARKPTFKEEEAKQILESFQPRLIFQHLSFVNERVRVIDTNIKELSAERNILLPWRALDVPLEDILSTDNLEIMPGLLGGKEWGLLEEESKNGNHNLHIEIINQRKEFYYILAIYLKREAPGAISLLKKHNFAHIVLPRERGKVSQVILRVEDDIKKLEEEKRELLNGVKGMLPQKLKLMLLADTLNNTINLGEASKQLLQTDFVCVLSGWIKEKDIAKLKDGLSKYAYTTEILLREPQPDEEVPIELENIKLIRPFEFITQIYGMPKYNELDPTPFLAPFFFIYFGFCVSDVGYGLILFLVCLLALTKFKMGPQGIKFFRLFLFCSISTMIVGALTGSWFGNLPDMLAEANKIFIPLKEFKDRLILLDPIQEPTKLLGIALSFGIIQVWFGNIVAIIGNLKNKRYLDAILDQVSMLVFLFGLTGLGLTFLGLGNAKYNSIFSIAAIAGAVALLLTQGRSNPTIGSKLFYGAYNLYSSLSGYLSDILSYSRLWALGLVTGVMANTINLISVQFSTIFTQAIPFAAIKVLLSAIILVVIFIGGHIVSFLMSLLGAFVHPLRLQFVEFFSKFFKAGGSAFAPFKAQGRYTIIE